MDSGLLKSLYDIIFYYIHEVPRLRRLFIRWSHLELNERIQIDEIIQIGLENKQKQLYNTLRNALDAWEHLQDTQGAPGFQSGSVQYTSDKTIEDNLTNIMTLLENCLDKFYNKNFGIAIEMCPVLKNEELSNEIFKYKTFPNECKSNSRVSRRRFQNRNSPRVRSTSTLTQKCILQTKSCTNLLKLSSSINVYQSD